MKICRFSRNGVIGIGRLENQQIRVCRGDLLGSMDFTGENVPLDQARLLAPLVPSKIVGIARNYVQHAHELGNVAPEEEPMIFLKPSTAVISPEESIVMPKVSARVDYEGELAVVIGRRASRVSEQEDPLHYVLGYSCLNDVTARDLQKKDVQFTRGKGFDTFCPFGPWIETELNPAAVNVETRVNGQVRQQGNTRNMIFSIGRLIRFVSAIMTLLPGDIIASGTPAGVGPLSAGDIVEVEVEGIGILRNPVAAQ